MDTFKKRLEFYMKKKGFNPTSLSRKARLSTTAVRDMLEHPGNPNPRIDTFLKLCLALEVLPHQLFPECAALYSPRQRQMLDKIGVLDEKEALHNESEKPVAAE